MSLRQRILIACPKHKLYVTGSYECDETGQYRLRKDGNFDVTRARCGQQGGRCMEVLCALHRSNRRGPGTWFPTDILAARESLNDEEPSFSSAAARPQLRPDLF